MTEDVMVQGRAENRRPEDDEINLLDLLIVLAKHKKKILLVPLLVAAITAGITLLMPNVYTATTKFFPPQGSHGTGSALMSQLGGQLGGLAGLAGGALGIKNPADMYIAILKSRPVKERLIKKFDLQKKMEHEFITDTQRYLDSVVSISSGKDGVISIDVDNEDPKLAADMANFYLSELKQVMATNAVTEAAQRRQFFERELKPAKDALIDAQNTLDRTPPSSLRYLDAMRDLKYREALWEVLVKQFEAAKLDEAKDAVFIQVIEQAVPPERKSKPKRALMVIMSGVVSGFLILLWVFSLESIRKADRARCLDPAWVEFKNYIKWRR